MSRVGSSYCANSRTDAVGHTQADQKVSGGGAQDGQARQVGPDYQRPVSFDSDCQDHAEFEE